LLAACGIMGFRNKFVKSAVVIFFVVINISSLLFTPFSASKMNRIEGFKPIGKVLNSLNLTQNDMVIAPYSFKYIYKYYPTENRCQLLPFNIFTVNNLRNSNFYDKDIQILSNNADKREALKSYFLSDIIPEAQQKYFKENLTDKVPRGHYVVFVEGPAVEVALSDKVIKKIISSETIYKTIPLDELLQLKFMNNLYKTMNNEFEFYTIKQEGFWYFLIYRKK